VDDTVETKVTARLERLPWSRCAEPAALGQAVVEGRVKRLPRGQFAPVTGGGDERHSPAMV